MRRMLVVTFTRAGRRPRCASASPPRLGEAAAEGDARLREQMLCLDRASISTLQRLLRRVFAAPTSRPRAWTPPSAYSTTPRMRACWTRRRTRPWTPSTRKAAKRLPASTPGAARTRCAIWRCASTPSSASAPTPSRGWNAPLTPDRRPCRRGRRAFCAPPAARLDAALAMTRAAHDHPGCPPHYAAALEKDLDALLELRGLEEAESAVRPPARVQAGAPRGPQPRRGPRGPRGRQSPAQGRRRLCQALPPQRAFACAGPGKMR